MKRPSTRLPAAGLARKALRERGQFWTPPWVARAMAAYVMAAESDHVFDPAVGGGAFFRAVRALEAEHGGKIELLGTELDPKALKQAAADGLTSEDLSGVRVADFLTYTPDRPLRAIVANPPYIRHHRLSVETKKRLRSFARELIGTTLDGRAGLHVYFLLRALQLLQPAGRLAFILPADTCEGVFAPALWAWICAAFRVDACVVFAPDATPFPGVDTNAIVFLIRNARPDSHFQWVRCERRESPSLEAWIASEFKAAKADLSIVSRSQAEALATGFSRPPIDPGDEDTVPLSEFATVLRGIATGGNEFFFLTDERVRELKLPREFLVEAIGRTRDVEGDAVTLETLKELRWLGRPKWLFSPDGRPLSTFPKPVRDYLKKGRALGVPERALVATRNPWYKMERRGVPDFLFAYLGRRNARFIRNRARVVPLTGFLCVYARRKEKDFVECLWRALSDARSVANLARVGKSYGGGAIKVEPRALERLPIPSAVLREAGLERATEKKQGRMVFAE